MLLGAFLSESANPALGNLLCVTANHCRILEIKKMNPFPTPDSILVMDNSSIHHNRQIKEIIEEKGFQLLYLPAYLPDLNPIKKGFSVLKANLQQYGNLDGGKMMVKKLKHFHV